MTSWRQVRGAARGSEVWPSQGRGPQILGCRRPPGSLRWLRYSPFVSGPPPALLSCPRRPARKTGSMCARARSKQAGCRRDTRPETAATRRAQSEERLQRHGPLHRASRVSSETTQEITEAASSKHRGQRGREVPSETLPAVKVMQYPC